jgi:predicted anti-sigma-YlaC factor YlaD
MRCEEIRDLAPEIALGIADGEERADALRHLSTCAECRRVVEQLSGVADELLTLAPVQEPRRASSPAWSRHSAMGGHPAVAGPAGCPRAGSRRGSAQPWRWRP